MSSDLYERENLIGTFLVCELITVSLMSILREDIGLSTSQHNGLANRRTSAMKQRKCLNAVAILSRIPLEPISARFKIDISADLLKLDKLTISRNDGLHFTETSRLGFLIFVRSASVRFLKSATRTNLEVHFMKTLPISGHEGDGYSIRSF
jgi:hypothetical protein